MKTLYAALVDETAPWPMKMGDGWDDLTLAFAGALGLGDALYVMMDHDLLDPEEVEHLSRHGETYHTFKPLISRAYLEAVAQGLVPGRLM